MGEADGGALRDLGGLPWMTRTTLRKEGRKDVSQ